MKKLKILSLTAMILFISNGFVFAQSLWNSTENNIYNTNTGNVGIGDATPDALLDVQPQSSISDNIFRVSGSTSNIYSVYLTTTVTSSSAGGRGVYIVPTMKGSGDFAGGLGISPTLNPTTNISTVYGTINNCNAAGSNNITSLYSNFYKYGTNPGQSGTITNGFSLINFFL